MLFIFKIQIARGLANYLIVENEFKQIEYAFVLSGNALDRATEAATLYHEGKIKKIVCTGENKSPDLQAVGIDTLESEISKLHAESMGVSSSHIILLPIGTSTFEEANAILDYCKEKKINEIVIVSSLFHTKRIENVFKPLFLEKGIEVYIKGAKSSQYDEMLWWESENGLIALNNEFVKLCYYSLKY
jgi:uncharacterized SAM-binding protein YcdF (DUF218 family)